MASIELYIYIYMYVGARTHHNAMFKNDHWAPSSFIGTESIDNYDN